MATSDQEMKDGQAEFEDEFNASDKVKPEQTEDEAFGLTPEPEAGAAAAATAPADEAAATGAAGVDAAAAAAAAVDAAKEEQRLRSWEGRLKAKEAELAAREAAADTTNVGEQQASEEAGETSGEEAAEQDDPGKALAEDFGEDFVDLLKKLISKICADTVGSGVGNVEATVNQVIEELRIERQENHFKRIAEAHEDFLEIVDSPEFAAWMAALTADEQAANAAIIESGSAQQIIDMLTKFKQSKEIGDDGALDGAEGVRSTGMKLPPPAKDGNDDYAAAWNES